MRYAVMQPTFVPWGGYFRLASSVDKFVFLDTVQLSKQSWQTRNRVLVGGRIHWVSVPIQHIAIDQRIDETRIANVAHWRKKISRLIDQSYARHQFKNDLSELVQIIENGTQEILSEFNISIITTAMSRMGIATPTCRASELALARADRTDRLIEIGEKLGCDTYLSPIGSSDYLSADGFVDRTPIKLEYANNAPPPYGQQGGGEFISHLSIIDIVGNLGWDGAAAYICGNWPMSGVSTPETDWWT